MDWTQQLMRAAEYWEVWNMRNNRLLRAVMRSSVAFYQIIHYFLENSEIGGEFLENFWNFSEILKKL